MAKGAYIGVDGKARKVKKIYIGVSNVAKKVKKAYIGVDGKARLCYSGAGVITYKKTITRPICNDFGSGAIGHYAVMGPGTQTDIDGYLYMYSYMNCYNSSFTATGTRDVGRSGYGIASSNDYMMIAGGSASGSPYDAVKAYNPSLTATNADSLPQAMSGLMGVTAGNKILFMGRDTSIYAYTGLTQTTYSNGIQLSTEYSATTSFGELAVVVRGGAHSNTTYSTDVYYYNSSITKSQFSTGLATPVTGASACSNGSYLLVGGGKYGDNLYTTTVNAFSKDFVRHTTNLSMEAWVPRIYNKSFGVEGYGVFVISASRKRAEAFDESLTRISINETISGVRYPTYIANKTYFLIMSDIASVGSDQYNSVYCYSIV